VRESESESECLVNSVWCSLQCSSDALKLGLFCFMQYNFDSLIKIKVITPKQHYHVSYLCCSNGLRTQVQSRAFRISSLLSSQNINRIRRRTRTPATQNATPLVEDRNWWPSRFCSDMCFGYILKLSSLSSGNQIVFHWHLCKQLILICLPKIHFPVVVGVLCSCSSDPHSKYFLLSSAS